MSTANLLLNIPHELSATQRANLIEAYPNSKLRIAPRDFLEHPDRIDGRDADVLVTELVPRNLHVWPKLRFIQLVSAGIDHLKDHSVWDYDIKVATASGIHSVPIAQFVTGAILTFTHRMHEISDLGRTRCWPVRESLAGSVLRGKSVGIIGYGNIGRECARQLHGLGMRIFSVSRNPEKRRDYRFLGWPDTGDPEGVLPEQWYGPQQLEEVLPKCDFLVITAPRTNDTVGLISERQLTLLPKGAVVIVVSRGGIVDEMALANCLRSGHLGAAWVDCFVEEPLPPTHSYFEIPNAILTPHMSGVFEEYWQVLLQLLHENLRRFANGQPMLNVVNV